MTWGVASFGLQDNNEGLYAEGARDYYNGPVYYYIMRLPLYLGFWVAFLPLAMTKPKGNAETTADSDRLLRVLLGTWFLIECVFRDIPVFQRIDST